MLGGALRRLLAATPRESETCAGGDRLGGNRSGTRSQFAAVPNLPPLPGVDAQTFLREREANHFVRERHDLNAAPAVTLPDLYEVPRGSLREAYGPAYFVPYYISALSSPDQEDRKWGLGALGEHQPPGTPRRG